MALRFWTTIIPFSFLSQLSIRTEFEFFRGRPPRVTVDDGEEKIEHKRE